MQIVTAPDYTGTGAKVALTTLLSGSPASQQCKWFQVIGISIGATPARVGDANVSSTQGAPITSTGAGQFNPPVAEVMQNYDLSTHYVWVGSGDKVSLSYAI